jgi:hypothetical protein
VTPIWREEGAWAAWGQRFVALRRSFALGVLSCQVQAKPTVLEYWSRDLLMSLDSYFQLLSYDNLLAV